MYPDLLRPHSSPTPYTRPLNGVYERARYGTRIDYQGLLAVNFGSTLLDLVDNVARTRAQALAEVQTQAATWDRLLKLRVPFFRKYTIGDLQARVDGYNQLHQILSGTVMGSLFHSFFALLNLGLLLCYSSQLAYSISSGYQQGYTRTRTLT